MDFLGNISLRLVGLLVTVGTLAAVYFFIVKPVTDTTESAFDSVAPAIESVQEQIEEAQKQAAEAAQQGNPGSLKQLQQCIAKAGQNTNRLERCANRFGS